MPKVRPLTQAQKAQNRWQKQDRNFAEQIGKLRGVSNLTDADLAIRLGLKCRQTVSEKLKHPSKLKKVEERLLAEVFEEYGLKYDFTMGEGGAARCRYG